MQYVRALIRGPETASEFSEQSDELPYFPY